MPHILVNPVNLPEKVGDCPPLTVTSADVLFTTRGSRTPRPGSCGESAEDLAAGSNGPMNAATASSYALGIVHNPIRTTESHTEATPQKAVPQSNMFESPRLAKASDPWRARKSLL